MSHYPIRGRDSLGKGRLAEAGPTLLLHRDNSGTGSRARAPALSNHHNLLKSEQSHGCCLVASSTTHSDFSYYCTFSSTNHHRISLAHQINHTHSSKLLSSKNSRHTFKVLLSTNTHHTLDVFPSTNTHHTFVPSTTTQHV